MLVWGDPSLYDSTLRVVETVAGLHRRVAGRLRRVERLVGGLRAGVRIGGAGRRAGAHFALATHFSPGDRGVFFIQDANGAGG